MPSKWTSMLLTWLAQQTRRILSDFHSVIFGSILTRWVRYNEARYTFTFYSDKSREALTISNSTCNYTWSSIPAFSVGAGYSWKSLFLQRTWIFQALSISQFFYRKIETPCTNTECWNGGSCIITSAVGNCQCLPGFVGVKDQRVTLYLF
jgi:hypothetical protein